MAIEPDVHLKPAWAEKGNFALLMKLIHGEDETLQRIEQLWCRRLADNRFELCCIPFFVYNLALGDEFEGEPLGGQHFAILRVLKRSGHSTFRAWFGDLSNPTSREEVLHELNRLGCLMEWHSQDLLAVDAASDSQAQAVKNVLGYREQINHLRFEIAHDNTDSGTVVHSSPAWRDRANFLIHARLEGDDSLEHWEQLWARRISESRFELCCIPFFVYDLALGDEVETGLEGEDRYVMQRVVKQSGHYTLRVWFIDDAAREEVPKEIARLGCLMEWRWSSSNLLAIDAPSTDLAQTVANLLFEREQLGHLEYETGRTH